MPREAPLAPAQSPRLTSTETDLDIHSLQLCVCVLCLRLFVDGFLLRRLLSKYNSLPLSGNKHKPASDLIGQFCFKPNTCD